jgi:hypothetical protein
MLKTIAKRSLIVLGALWPERENPPVSDAGRIEATTPVPPDVLATLNRACTDCHSHETRWPWYSHVAPASWLIAHDVEEGREHLNMSEWARYGNEDKALRLGEICKELRSDAMPLPRYRRLHPEARLSQEEKEAICAWTRGESQRLLSQISSP